MKVAPGYNVPVHVVEAYIRMAAQKRGIDPDTAVRVAKTEGLNTWRSTVRMKGGGREPSYGPFQLYTGGGLGNSFQKETGLNPADPNNWKASVDYALDNAAKNGWKAFHGARDNGIPRWAGIRPGESRAMGVSAQAQRPKATGSRPPAPMQGGSLLAGGPPMPSVMAAGSVAKPVAPDLATIMQSQGSTRPLPYPTSQPFVGQQQPMLPQMNFANMFGGLLGG